MGVLIQEIKQDHKFNTNNSSVRINNKKTNNSISTKQKDEQILVALFWFYY